MLPNMHESLFLNPFEDIFDLIPDLVSIPHDNNNCGFYAMISLRDKVDSFKGDANSDEISVLREIIQEKPNERICSKQFFQLLELCELDKNEVAILSYSDCEESSLFECPPKPKYLVCIICGHFYVKRKNTKDSVNILKLFV